MLRFTHPTFVTRLLRAAILPAMLMMNLATLPRTADAGTIDFRVGREAVCRDSGAHVGTRCEPRAEPASAEMTRRTRCNSACRLNGLIK